MIELTVKFIGDDKKRHSQSFLLYDSITLDAALSDEKLREYIKEARQSISWVPEETKLKFDVEVI